MLPAQFGASAVAENQWYKYTDETGKRWRIDRTGVVAMRCFPLLLPLVLLLSLLIGPASFAASSDPQAKIQSALNSVLPSTKTAKSPTARQPWSRKRKICTAIVLGCVIATAIAVPVAVGAHHQHEAHQQSRERTVLEELIHHQQVIASQQEQGIRNLLAQGPNVGPTLSASQLSALQANLGQVRQAESMLNLAFNDLILHRSIATAAVLNRNADVLMRAPNMFASDYQHTSGALPYKLYPESDFSSVVINHGPTVPVSSVIDSGGVYGTVPAGVLGHGHTSGHLPAGAVVSVYSSDGHSLLYQYTTAGSHGPSLIDISNFNTGYIPFSQGPVYVSNSHSDTFSFFDP